MISLAWSQEEINLKDSLAAEKTQRALDDYYQS